MAEKNDDEDDGVPGRALAEILAEARDQIIAQLAEGDEFLHRLKEKEGALTSLQWNEPVRQQIERVLNEIEGLRRRLVELAP